MNQNEQKQNDKTKKSPSSFTGEPL